MLFQLFYILTTFLLRTSMMMGFIHFIISRRRIKHLKEKNEKLSFLSASKAFKAVGRCRINRILSLFTTKSNLFTPFNQFGGGAGLFFLYTSL